MIVILDSHRASIERQADGVISKRKGRREEAPAGAGTDGDNPGIVKPLRHA